LHQQEATISTVSLLALIGFFGGAVCVAFVIMSKVSWQLKLGLVVTNLLMAAMIYPLLQEFEGWPVIMRPPETFQYYAHSIRSPNEQIGFRGAIDILLSYAGTDKPRLVELPYDTTLANQLDHADIEVAAGRNVILKHRPHTDTNDRGHIEDWEFVGEVRCKKSYKDCHEDGDNNDIPNP
jgi:hypothetical protein